MKKVKTSIFILIVAATLLFETSVVSTTDQAANLDSSYSQANRAAAAAIELEKAVPDYLNARVGDESEISSYKEVDTGINSNATVSFVDPLQAVEDANPTSRAGDHRVYKKTEYAIGNLTAAGTSVGPINNQIFIVSAAKGHTSHASQSVTVTGKLSITGTFDDKVLELVNAALNLSARGSASKTYSTSDTWAGPPEDSVYNSREYYGAINYDKYDITIIQSDYYDEYIGRTFVGTTSEISGYIYVSEALKPKNIEYSVDQQFE